MGKEIRGCLEGLVNETNRHRSFLNCPVLGPNPLSSAAHRPLPVGRYPHQLCCPSFLSVGALTRVGSKHHSSSGGSANRLSCRDLVPGSFALTLPSKFLWLLPCSIIFSLFSQQQERGSDRIPGPCEARVFKSSPLVLQRGPHCRLVVSCRPDL